MSQGKVVDPRYAKSGEYRTVIEAIQEKGDCPFCQEDLGGKHKHPILRERFGWRLTQSSWPYENAEHHLLLIPRRHIESLEELTLWDLWMVHRLALWAKRNLGIRGGALPFRFGETTYTGATVCHLHYHLIQPKKGKTVNFPIG